MKLAIIVSAKGYHWVELASPIFWCEKKSISYTLFTPEGSAPNADPYSLETRPLLSRLGLGSPKKIAPESYFGTQLIMNLNESEPVSSLNVDEFDALYIPGGHGCLFDINENKEVQEKVRLFLKADKPVGAVCHATSTIALADKKKVAGITMTGFPDFLDKILLLVNKIHPTFLPIPISNEKVLKKAGVRNGFFNRCKALLIPSYTVKAKKIITGVGPMAAKRVVKELVRTIQ